MKLSEIPKNKILGVCYFDNFHQAMELSKEIVKLKPTCVELMDQNLLNLAKEIPMYAGGIKKYIKGNPEAVLMVEFIDAERSVYEKKIKDLEYLVLNQNKKNEFAFYSDLSEQKEVFEIRKAGLNILMSMKGDRKPVAFIEDLSLIHI